MKYAFLFVMAFCCLLIGGAAFASNPIDEYSSHRTVRLINDCVDSLNENILSMHHDCEEIEDFLWCDTSYVCPMMAAGAAGSSWDHFQEAFVWQERLNVMNTLVAQIETQCNDLLAEPPDNWQICPQALGTAAEIKSMIPAMKAHLDEIQYWLDQSFAHRDYQQINVQDCALLSECDCMKDKVCDLADFTETRL
jgi:hypothetical protein